MTAVLADFPNWSFDGGSTQQGSLSDSDRILHPVDFYKDPFVQGGYIVLCEVLNPDGTPHESNNRALLRESAYTSKKQDPWFGFEQEYTLFDTEGRPLAFKENSPAPQGPYYCGVGATKALLRDLVVEHLECCERAGIFLDGANAEVMPGQWEFQTNAGTPLKVSDDLWVARYILERLSEKYDVVVSYDPKPLEGWNGAGCHTNFSTKDMREGAPAEEGGLCGYEFIKHAIERLENSHMEHIKVYGTGIAKRLTGEYETSPVHEFSWGVADRGASIRVPAQVYSKERGYLEDRRPNANIDPYKVTNIILKTVLGLE
jgi:glutamine synthetase